MRDFSSIMLLCGLLAGCSPAPETGGDQRVIFPANKAESLALAAGWEGMDYWTPVDADVAEAAPRIKAFLREQAPSIAGRWAEYRCQYLGFVVEGKKRLYCNFFRPGPWADGWQTELVIVFDGGDDFFQLEYDVESNQCLNFHVNGEA